jgi:hypothetical protein
MTPVLIQVWEPSIGNANRYPSNSLINRISMLTNYRNNTWIVASSVYTWVRLKTSTEIYGKKTPISQQDASDQLACTFPAVHFACSRGTFCKSQCNQRQEQVGEDFSGNQPDQLTLWLHRTSLNSMPHRASSSEEQDSQQWYQQQRCQPTSTTVARPSRSTADQ